MAEISSRAIPLEKAINNGEGPRDEMSRLSTVALTMRGSPSFVFFQLTFHGRFKKKQQTDRSQSRKRRRAGALALKKGLGIDWRNVGEAVGTVRSPGQGPERAQLHSSAHPGRVCGEAPPSCALCV